MVTYELIGWISYQPLCLCWNISCKCTGNCSSARCSCSVNRLPCTDACMCGNRCEIKETSTRPTTQEQMKITEVKSCNVNENTSCIKTITLDQGAVLGKFSLFVLLQTNF